MTASDTSRFPLLSEVNSVSGKHDVYRVPGTGWLVQAYESLGGGLGVRVTGLRGEPLPDVSAHAFQLLIGHPIGAPAMRMLAKKLKEHWETLQTKLAGL